MWRYAILWLEGGVYADIDVYAYAPIAELARSSAGEETVAVRGSDSTCPIERRPHFITPQRLPIRFGTFAFSSSALTYHVYV